MIVNPLYVRRMRRHGIVHPIWTIQAAKYAHIPLSLACAILDRETEGGHNIWGHDGTIFVGGWRDRYGHFHTEVTEASYLTYKGERGHVRMQGVGPCQLTYWSVQDEADRLGGCWKPKVNMRVGFSQLAENIREHPGDLHSAVRAYNGVGLAAENYANEVLAGMRRWHTILTGR